MSDNGMEHIVWEKSVGRPGMLTNKSGTLYRGSSSVYSGEDFVETRDGDLLGYIDRSTGDFKHYN